MDMEKRRKDKLTCLKLNVTSILVGDFVGVNNNIFSNKKNMKIIKNFLNTLSLEDEPKAIGSS